MKGTRRRLYSYLSRLPLSQKLIGGLISVVFAITLIATTAVLISAYIMSKHYVLPSFFFVFMGFSGAIVLLSFFLLIFIVTRFIRRFVNRPVLHLIRVANKVSEQEDYSVRAREFHKDEIGQLAKTFNLMLNRIQLREQELTHFHNYLNDIIDSMPSALLAIDHHRVINQCNCEAAKLADQPLGQIIGKSVEQAFPFLYRCTDTIQKALSEQSSQRIEKLPIKLENSENYLDLVIYPLSSSHPSGAVIIIDNVTRRLRFEEMMVQTEKMMSVGALAAGMAHEINNPLGAILQGSQNIRRRMSSSLPANQKTANQLNINLNDLNRYLQERDILKFLDSVQDAGERAAKIVSNMLLFSRSGDLTLTPTHLTELIECTIGIATSDLGLKNGLDFMQIRVNKELDPALGEVPCIASEIQQVLLNLLKNAAFAIHNRTDKTDVGQITIRTVKENDCAMITVADNGMGMDHPTRKRIFEPFFTTKEIGSGTGLGLSVSYFIITNHHKGSINAFSVPDRGTEFTITLPLTTETEFNPESKSTQASA